LALRYPAHTVLHPDRVPGMASSRISCGRGSLLQPGCLAIAARDREEDMPRESPEPGKDVAWDRPRGWSGPCRWLDQM